MNEKPKPLCWSQVSGLIYDLYADDYATAKVLLPNGQLVYVTGFRDRTYDDQLRSTAPCLIVQTEDKCDFSTEDE